MYIKLLPYNYCKKGFGEPDVRCWLFHCAARGIDDVTRPNTYARSLTKWTAYCLIGTARSSHRNDDPDYQVWERRADVHHILSCHLHLASGICGGCIYDMYSTDCIFWDASAGYGDCFILRHMLYINRIDLRWEKNYYNFLMLTLTLNT